MLYRPMACSTCHLSLLRSLPLRNLTSSCRMSFRMMPRSSRCSTFCSMMSSRRYVSEEFLRTLRSILEIKSDRLLTVICGSKLTPTRTADRRAVWAVPHSYWVCDPFARSYSHPSRKPDCPLCWQRNWVGERDEISFAVSRFSTVIVLLTFLAIAAHPVAVARRTPHPPSAATFALPPAGLFPSWVPNALHRTLAPTSPAN